MFVEVRYGPQTAGPLGRTVKYGVIAKDDHLALYMQATASLVILVMGHSNIWR